VVRLIFGLNEKIGKAQHLLKGFIEGFTVIYGMAMSVKD